MRSRKVSAIVLTAVAGAVLLIYGSMNLRHSNWEPVHHPYPRTGVSSTSKFFLTSGGRFALEVSTPAQASDAELLHREQPDVTAQLAVVISGPDNFQADRQVLRFHNGGWTSGSNLFFPDSTFDLPRGGHYLFSVTSQSTPNLFISPGAMLSFRRFEPVGPEFVFAAEQWIGGALVVAALVATALLRASRSEP